MKILVLNGSPKGEYSSTLYTSLYLAKLHPEHEFSHLNVGQKIKYYEKHFDEVINNIKEADVIIFSYPVYTFIAPSQLHRVIELLKESKIDLSNKFATQITTSKHFYDITAHNYIKENCLDMNMKFVNGLSADMDDLPTKKGQKDADEFFKHLIYCVENNIYERNYFDYSKNTTVDTDSVENVTKTSDKKVVIVTDLVKEDEKLNQMIQRFTNKLSMNYEIVNIHDHPFQGGCISCFNCATSGKCIYTDQFDEFLRNKIQVNDAIVYAFTIKDHSMGVRFKIYDDRQFCNGHRTVTMGMPFAYLINGNYHNEKNLMTIIEGRAEVGQNYLAGVATNEVNPNEEIDKLVANLEYAINNKYVQPSNFLGVGGMKIFRDLIYLMRGMMRADHKFYKKHHQYDFPQKKKGTIIGMYLVGWLMSNKKLKAKMGNKMNEGMIMPYKKVLDNLDKKK